MLKFDKQHVKAGSKLLFRSWGSHWERLESICLCIQKWRNGPTELDVINCPCTMKVARPRWVLSYIIHQPIRVQYDLCNSGCENQCNCRIIIALNLSLLNLIDKLRDKTQRCNKFKGYKVADYLNSTVFLDLLVMILMLCLDKNNVLY